jgi:hypothetical protein
MINSSCTNSNQEKIINTRQEHKWYSWHVNEALKENEMAILETQARNLAPQSHNLHALMSAEAGSNWHGRNI